MDSYKVSAILPAGGIGERTTLDIPKQFYPVCGKPLICYAIEELERIPWIQKVAVVVALQHLETMQKIIVDHSYKKIVIALGGASRHRSIFAGVKVLQEVDPEVVIIHDAVRPFIPLEILKETVLAARVHGAAGAVRPLVSTVLSSDEDGFLSETLDRTKYLASEMPQAFQLKIISKAYEKCNEYDLDYGTECLHLVHKYCGIKVKLLSGPPELWKVTHKKDIYAAKGIISENEDETKPLTIAINGHLDENFTTHIQEILRIKGNFQTLLSLDNIALSSSYVVVLHIQEEFIYFEKWCKQHLLVPLKQVVIHILKIHLNINFNTIISSLKQLDNEARKKNKMFHFIWITEKDWTDEILLKLSTVISNLLKHSSSEYAGQLHTI